MIEGLSETQVREERLYPVLTEQCMSGWLVEIAKTLGSKEKVEIRIECGPLFKREVLLPSGGYLENCFPNL